MTSTALLHRDRKLHHAQSCVGCPHTGHAAKGQGTIPSVVAPLDSKETSETATWCASRADPRDPFRSLRSVELCPAELSPPTRDRGSFRSTPVWGLSTNAITRRIADLVETRRKHLSTERSNGTWSCAAKPGKLLVYDPGANLADGAAEVESDGFFDCDNAPPWDTWVAFVVNTPRRAGKWTPWDHYLIAWIPEVLHGHAQRGIDVNPEGCIAWLSR